MTRFATLLIGSALTSLIASHGFAADAVPEASQPSSASQVAAPADTAAAAASSATSADAPSQATAVPKEVKVGYISMMKVAAESAEGKAATAKLKSKSEKLRAKLEARQKQLEKQQAAIEAKLSTMTPKERQAKGIEFQKKMDDFQKLVRSSELEVVELQDKLTAEVYLSIKDAVVEYAKANGYTLLVEEKSVLYIVDTIKPTNLTEEVIALLGKKRAK